MATVSLGSVYAELELVNKNFTKTLNDAKKDLNNFENNVQKTSVSGTSAFASLSKSISQYTKSISSAILDASKTASTLTFAGIGATAVAMGIGLKKASNDAKEFEKSMITLDIIAGRFGESGEKAKNIAVELGKELRIGTGASADALQNLLKSGLTLDQSSDLIKRFTNEAITGKSASINLATAVTNLSFAFATGNSALGNMSGISENWSNITENGAKVLKKWNGTASESSGITVQLAGQIREYEKQLKIQGKTLDINDEGQQKYIGLLQLTNLTMGSAERFTGTLIDREAQLSGIMTELSVVIGQAINPVIADLYKQIIDLLPTVDEFKWLVQQTGEVFRGFWEAIQTDDLGRLSEAFKNLGIDQKFADTLGVVAGKMRDFGNWVIANQDTILIFLKNLAIAFVGLSIIGTIAGLFNPFILVLGTIATLLTLWETDFMGIKTTITDFANTIERTLTPVLNVLGGIFNDFLKPALQELWRTISEDLLPELKKLWDLISPILIPVLKVLAGIITGILIIALRYAIEVITDVVAFISLFIKAIVWLANEHKRQWEVIKGLWNDLKTIVSMSLTEVLTVVGKKMLEIWDKVKETAGKIGQAIKDAFNPFKHGSPSVAEHLKKLQSLANKTFASIDVPLFGHDLGMNLSAPSLSMSGVETVQPTQVSNVTLNVNIGTYAGSAMEKRELAKTLWDSLQDYNKGKGIL